MDSRQTIPPDPEDSCDAAVASFFQALDAGEPLDPQEWLKRHPGLTVKLRAFLAAQEEIGRVAEPLRTAPPSAEMLRSFGDYEILEEIGRGGMGVVYRARQKSLDRVVALKMILSGVHAEEADLARFRTEAEAIARLQHPNIVQVYEVGEHEGKPFISLEFCTGDSLAKKLDSTPLPPKEAAQLAETLARAVQAAHEKKVIHRDLKPANVLLTESGQLKITDFGLAKKTDETGQTASGAIVGTPSYMAPEQAGGKSKEVGPAADIYALGAILYELLTGRPPFKAATPLDTVLQVLSDEPVSPRQLQRKTPLDLETICLKCLHKEPRRRYGSALALAEDLARFQAGKPVQARPVGRLERSWRWCRRNPAAAALMLSLLLGAAVASGLAVVADQNAEEARLNAEQARKEKEETRKQLELARESVFTAQLARVEAALGAKETNRARELLHDYNFCPIDLRDFAWRFYNTGKIAVPLKGDSHQVVSLAFSRDGLQLASCARRETAVRLWDVHTGKECASLQGHAAEVTSVAFSIDGQTLTSRSGDGLVKLWDLQTCKERASFKHTGAGGVLSTDGQTLASANLGEPVELWDVQTGRLRTSLKHTDVSLVESGVAFSNDGQTLAILSPAIGVDDKARPRTDEIKLWDVQTGRLRASFQADAGGVASLGLSSDGQTLAWGSRNGSIKLRDVKTGQERASLKGPTGTILSLALSGDGQTLASGNLHGLIKLWNVKTGQERASLQGHANPVGSLSFSGDGQTLASGSVDGSIKLWKAGMSPEHASFKGDGRGTVVVAFSGDGQTLASNLDDSFQLWDIKTGQLRASLQGQIAGARSVAFSNDGQTVAYIDPPYDGTIKLWSFKTGKACAFLKQGGNGPFALSSDGQTLASRGGNMAIKLWDVKAGKVRATLPGPTGERLSMAFSRDGQTFASGSRENNLIRLWDAPTGQERASLEHPGVLSLAFSGDGQTLASGSRDNTVKLWDIRTGKERASLKGHRGGITAVAFTWDGQGLASGSTEGTIKLWDVEGGKERAFLTGDGDEITTMAFTPNGKTLASGSADGVIKLWDVQAARGQAYVPGYPQSAPTNQEHASLNTFSWGVVGFIIATGIIAAWAALKRIRRSPRKSRETNSVA
jgi:WD40 repeat protein